MMTTTARQLVVTGMLTAFLAGFPGPLLGEDIELVSIDRRGFTGDGPSQGAAVSGDGRFVAFLSEAINLLPNNSRNGFRDVYIRDRGEPAITELISVAFDGAEANGTSGPGGSASVAINVDGCLVAFSSRASNLVEGDENGVEDVFVRDRCAGHTERVSVGIEAEANGVSSNPDLSTDGRFVVFQSRATNLVDGDSNARADIFVYDRETGQTQRASVANSTGEEADADSVLPAISGDGRVVAFESTAGNLAEGAGGRRHVFVHELDTGLTELASVDSEEEAGNGPSFAPDLSFDGSIVAFKSEASNLVDVDTNGVSDTFARDRGAGATERVSVDDFGNQAQSLSAHPSVSDDGRFVSFPSWDDFFDPEDGNRKSDIFVYDRWGSAGNRVARVSVEPRDKAEVGVPEVPPSVSANGQWIAFVTASSVFMPPTIDNNNALDAFVTCNPLGLPCQCVVSEDCPGEQVCETSNNQCVTPTPTPTPTNTPTPTTTSTPAWTPISCVDDEDCPPGSNCIEGECVPQSCEVDSDCPPASVCQDGQCRPVSCDDDEDCPPASTCEDGQCAVIPCTGDGDCPPGAICTDGECVAVSCEEDSDCPPASTCQDGQCQPVSCDDDEDCPPASTCEDGQCAVIPCSSDEQCPPGAICTDGECVAVSCETDEDCPVPSKCDDGQCVPIDCTTDEQCPPGSICDPEEQHCVKPRSKGGGGCSIQAGPSDSAPSGLLLLIPVLGIWLRRRRVGRAHPYRT